MVLRAVVTALASFALLAPVAQARDALPLTGQGENIEPVARVPFEGANEVELAGDWAFVSVDQAEFGGHDGGLVIVNIADPRHPFIQSRWMASTDGITDAGFGDVDLSVDGNLAVLTNAHCDDCEEGKVPWVVLIDVSDKSHPRLVGKIVDDGTMDYVHTSTLDGTTLYTNPQVAAFYPQPGNSHVTVFDVSNPAKPVKKGVISPPGSDAGLAHDSYIDHRPDGKSLMYSASVHKSDVIDVTNPLGSTWLQSSISTYTISHDVQPNYDRSVIIVDDEGAAGGQLDERVSACGKAGRTPATVDSGSVHFYAAAPDGTFANGGAVHLGSFNAPTNVNTGACVAHVFWQAPNENRLTQAYYRTGAFIVDFKDPAAPKMLGWFLPDGGAEYWSNKPHRGFLYASDMEHGLDILRYVGEGGKRWPATAGPAEVQRAQHQGLPYVPVTDSGAGTGPATAAPQTEATATLEAAPAPQRATSAAPRQVGRFRLRMKVARVPGRHHARVPLTLTFTDSQGRVVRRMVVKRRAGRAAVVTLKGVAVAGRYTWRVTSGRRLLRRGGITVKARAGLSLAPTSVLVVRRG